MLSWMVTTSQQERQRQTSSVAAKPEPGRCRFELQQAASLLVVLLQLKLVISIGLGKQAASTGGGRPLVEPLRGTSRSRGVAPKIGQFLSMALNKPSP